VTDRAQVCYLSTTNRTYFQMLVTDCPRLWRQTVINIKRKRFLNLVTRHRLLNFRFQIQNSVGEWLADPGCFPKESNADLKPRAVRTLPPEPERKVRVVAGHVFKSLRSWLNRPAPVPRSSLRPHWHRVLREAGAGQPFVFTKIPGVCYATLIFLSTAVTLRCRY
jgi:hypothetical protein